MLAEEKLRGGGEARGWRRGSGVEGRRRDSGVEGGECIILHMITFLIMTSSRGAGVRACMSKARNICDEACGELGSVAVIFSTFFAVLISS
jgi:hypothetical protein